MTLLTTRSTLHKPSKVERARERLAEAVARLERALPSSEQTAGAQTAGAQTAGATAGATVGASADDSTEITELMAGFQDLQAENSRLRDRNRQVSERLGAAIDRFKLAIGD